jgi:glycosyltransferase involved in cell wall biosynthesis
MFLFLVPFVPFISVIITAHNRREFLLEAVNSALNQTLPKDEYEIIVVKNFEDERIDRFLEEHNVKNIVMKEEPLGAKIARGVEESKGEVISLLDDDDLWLPQKLEKVKQVFKDENVMYYHNNRYNFYGSLSIDSLIDNIKSNKDSGKLLKLTIRDMNKSLSPPGNNSSITVRKKIFSKNALDKIKNVYLAVDALLFYLAYCNNGYFVFDDQILTLRRVHTTNYSAARIIDYESWLAYASNSIKKFKEDFMTFLDLFTHYDECEIPNEYKKRLISHLEASYVRWVITYSRLPNTKNELTLRALIKYFKYQLKYQRSLKPFLRGLYTFLPFAPKIIKDYATKRWHKDYLRTTGSNRQ